MLADTALEYLGRLSKTTQDPQLLWEVAEGYHKLSQLIGWSTKASLGRMDDGIAAGANAIAIEESLLARHALSQEQIERLVDQYLEQGFSLRVAWREREGATVLARGLEVAQQYVPARVPAVQSRLAGLYDRIGRIAEAHSFSTVRRNRSLVQARIRSTIRRLRRAEFSGPRQPKFCFGREISSGAWFSGGWRSPEKNGD
jgi:hypothetical protein